ncbi:LPXTG cell wall anchor domain-containing protein, partial [Streptococcus salivarius]
ATSVAPANSTTPATSETPANSTTPATSETPAVSTTPATSEAPAVSTTPATSEAPAVSTTPAASLVPTKDNHSMNFVTPSYTQTRSAGIKSETDGKLTSQDLPKTGDTNSKVGMLGMVLVGLGLTSFVYKGRHRRS